MTHENYIHTVNALQRYDAAYFSGNPLITDREYDLLYFAAQDYERQNPSLILPDSPTQKAHAEIVNGHRKIQRRNTLLSIEKAKSTEELVEWMNDTSEKTASPKYTVEWKYDGICASLIYVKGMLVEASYGKKYVGMDFLQTAIGIPSIPKQIPTECERVEVRGEVLVMFGAYQSLSRYKDCRSAASGILADTNTTLPHFLTFIPYWTDLPFQKGSFPALRDRLTVLAGMGFYTDLHITKFSAITVTTDSVGSVVEQAALLRASLPFPTDGLVIKAEDMSKWDSLGKTAHHYKYAIAYKFPPSADEKAITTILNIVETVGETGKLTPVAHFNPVTLKGRTFEQSSLGSWNKVYELGLYEGAVVNVSIHNGVNLYIDGLASTSSVMDLSSSAVSKASSSDIDPIDIDLD